MDRDEAAMATNSRAATPRLFDEGTRVDCLFDDDYFRGTVDASYNSYNSYKENGTNGDEDDDIQLQRRVAVLFRVCFDDGDVRDDVPPADLELPLQPGSRVECLFEGEGGYFDGAIGRDNGDATYRVDFDDGDVLETAPRRDMNAILAAVQTGSPTQSSQEQEEEEHVAKNCVSDDGINFRGEDTADDREEGPPCEEAPAADEPRHGELPPGGGEPSRNMPPNSDFDNENSTPSSAAAVTATVLSSSSSSSSAAAAAAAVVALTGTPVAGAAAAAAAAAAAGAAVNDATHGNRQGVLEQTNQQQPGYDDVTGPHAAKELPKGKGAAYINHHDDVKLGAPYDGSRKARRDREETATPSTRRSYSRNSSAASRAGSMEGHESEDGYAGLAVKLILGAEGDDHNARHRDDPGLGRVRVFAQLPPEYVPTVANPLHLHLETLAAAPPGQEVVGEAPPDFRLSALSYRIASLEKKLREQEGRGEAWTTPVFSSARSGIGAIAGGPSSPNGGGGGGGGGGQSDQGDSDPAQGEGADDGCVKPTTAAFNGGRGGTAATSFPSHLSLRKVVENLSTLRMRQVALVRLCYGEASQEMVQALCDLAEGYAKEGLWPQVSNHMARAASVLAPDNERRSFTSGNDEEGAGAVVGTLAWQQRGGGSPDALSRRRRRDEAAAGGRGAEGEGRGVPLGLAYSTDERYTDPNFCRSLGPGGCARLLLEIFRGLRAVAAEDEGGKVRRENMEAFMLNHADQGLRSAIPGLLGLDMPRCCCWGAAVGHIRERSTSFADLNLKVLENVQPQQVARARLAFEAADPEGRGCAHAERFLQEFQAGFRGKEGSLSDAAWCPGLVSAIGELVRGRSWRGDIDQTAEEQKEPSSGGPRLEPNLLALEEVLALMAILDEKGNGEGRECSGRQMRRYLLGVRVKLLTGRCQTHTNSLPMASRNLSEALSELERLGLGEMSSCVPVLNALADSMALTHRRQLERSAMKAKKLAEAWIREPEGQEIWKQECRRLLMECRSRLEVVPRAEIELRTWQALVVYRSKVLAKELGGQGKELGDAEDYLVRAWEILESNLGRANPDIGAACISLGNLAIIRHRPTEATDWFRRALRTFQDCFPEGYTPITASTAVTLGNLLAKQAATTSQGGGRLEEPHPDGGTTSQEDRQGSVQPERDPLQDAWGVGALSEATELLENAAKFYSGRVEEATLTLGHCGGGGGGEDAHGVPGSPCVEDTAFAWSDPDVAGSRLDPQTADFARRAAELWTQAVGLRELSANQTGEGQGVRHVKDGAVDTEDDAGTLARVVEQAARSTELARGPCSVALGRLCQKLGEARQEDGDYSGAKDAFCRARAVFTDRYGRNDPRAKQAAAAAAATTAAVATAAPKRAPPPTPAEGRAFNAARCR